MGIWIIITISFFITVIINQRLEFAINDQNIKSNWSAIEKYLKKQTVLDLHK